MGFNSGFKGLIVNVSYLISTNTLNMGMTL
jgi:hypothetical protein